MNQKIKLFFLCLIIFGICPKRLNAADAILLRKTGVAELKRKQAKVFRKVSAGASLKAGDTLRTLKDAKAQVLFSNGVTVLIKPETSMRISKTGTSYSVRIPKGEFLIGLKKPLARRESFRVRTPAAIASVRGTLFWGLSDAEKNSTYACFHNEIAITAKNKTIILKAGEKTFIPYGQPPQKSEPHQVPAEYLNTFEVEGTIENLQDLLK